MGGGVSVCNNTGIELLFTLSQVGPLHWERVLPGNTKKIDCGKVWFTVSAKLWDGNEPDDWDVAKPFVIGIGAGVAIVGGVAAIAIAAPAAAAGTATAGTVAAVEGGAVAAGTGGTSVLAAGTTAAAAGVGAEVAATGGTSALLVAGTGAITTGVVTPVVVETNIAENYKKSLAKVVAENSKKWLAYTPSKESADWLAKNNIIAVIPVSEGGVYANGKTITVSYELVTNDGGSRMKLKLSGT